MSENKARLDNVAHAITDALLDGPLYPYLAGKESPGETACNDTIYAMAGRHWRRLTIRAGNPQAI